MLCAFFLVIPRHLKFICRLSEHTVWYSLCKRLLGLRYSLDGCGGILPPTGFVLWSVQSVAICYNDYTILVPSHGSLVIIRSHKNFFTYANLIEISHPLRVQKVWCILFLSLHLVTLSKLCISILCSY
jgi:hypothetical protein